ncbi:MAG: hypothetical protein GY739_12305, partial [Mesoflavibacter sp.]|nr:hypothetical protein [Mesoflavibacter sp.]
DICGKTFSSQLKLNGHISLHRRNREYKSKDIPSDIDGKNKIFFVRKELGEKVYCCKFCDKNFTSLTGVLFHASHKHITNGDDKEINTQHQINKPHNNTIFR